MTRILVTPDRLRALSGDLDRTAQELRGLEGRFGGAYGNLEWAARSRSGTDGDVSDARGRARSLVARAEELASFLRAKAGAFEGADQQGVDGLDAVLGQLPTLARDWLAGAGATYAFPGSQVAALLGMAGAGGAAAGLFPVPKVGGQVWDGLVQAGGRGLQALRGTEWELASAENLRGSLQALRDLGAINKGDLSGLDRLVLSSKLDPAFVVLDAATEYATSSDHTWHGAEVSTLTAALPDLATIGLWAICPPAGAVATGLQIGDSLIEMVGKDEVQNLRASGHADWANDAQAVLSFVDLHQHERDLSEWLVDSGALTNGLKAAAIGTVAGPLAVPALTLGTLAAQDVQPLGGLLSSGKSLLESLNL